MTRNINKNLLEKLICPNCKANVFMDGDKLRCEKCRNVYLLDYDIPALVSERINKEHLKTEEELFQKMREGTKNKNKDLSNKEWKKSKQDFWSVVKRGISGDHAEILNIGCGYDNSFVEFEKEGHTFVNMDITDSSLRYLKTEYDANNCVVGDVNSMPFKNDSFDIVTCIDVLHHEERNTSNILKSIYRILKHDGVLYIQDVNAWGMFQFYKSIFLPQFVHKILRKIYHRIKKTEHVPAEYEFPTNPLKVKKLLSRIGFRDVMIHKNNTHPEIGKLRMAVFNKLNKNKIFSKYHNYHYFISVKK